MRRSTVLPENTPITPRPKSAYWRIESEMREKIRTHAWSAGTMLPGRQVLAREYGVARGTVDRAIANLVADGTLFAQEGRGTFVGGDAPLSSPTAPIPYTPPALPKRQPVAARLGIIAALPATPQSVSSDLSATLWIDTVIASLERVFAALGGRESCFYMWDSMMEPTEALGLSVSAALREGVDAIAIVALHENKGVDNAVYHAQSLAGQSVPLVCLSWHEMQRPIANVFYDQAFAGYVAADHLLQRGYDSLHYFAPFAADWIQARITGARAAVRQAGLPPETLTIVPHENRETLPPYISYYSGRDQTMYHFVREWLRTRNGRIPTGTGIIALNDWEAGEIRRALDAGTPQKPGADYGLIGFDDSPQSRMHGLTSLRPPLEEMGTEAARLLHHLLAGEGRHKQVRLFSHLLPRKSTNRKETPTDR